jgi:TRAP-type C4-dicarboxylate transport system permease small subunit
MRGRLWLSISIVLAATYAIYVLWSKFAKVVGLAPPIRLGDVGEFLLFAGAILALTLQSRNGRAVTVRPAKISCRQRSHGPPMKRLLKNLDDNAERYLMLACYTFCCAVIIQDVARRYLLNYSAGWSQETAQYAFIYLGWIGAASAVKERAHVRFDILLNRLPERLHGYIYIFSELATLAFALIALRYTLHSIAQDWQFGNTTDVLRVSRIWAEAAVPIGFSLIVIRTLQAMARDIAAIREGRPAYRGKAMFEE